MTNKEVEQALKDSWDKLGVKVDYPRLERLLVEILRAPGLEYGEQVACVKEALDAATGRAYFTGEYMP